VLLSILTVYNWGLIAVVDFLEITTNCLINGCLIVLITLILLSDTPIIWDTVIVEFVAIVFLCVGVNHKFYYNKNKNKKHVRLRG
jgi:hypothetical protein